LHAPPSSSAPASSFRLSLSSYCCASPLDLHSFPTRRSSDLDAEFTEETPIIDFRIGSDAYFSLLRVYPEALDFARLGSDVSFRLGDVFVRLGESGLESIEESDLKSLIG